MVNVLHFRPNLRWPTCLWFRLHVISLFQARKVFVSHYDHVSYKWKTCERSRKQQHIVIALWVGLQQLATAATTIRPTKVAYPDELDSCSISPFAVMYARLSNMVKLQFQAKESDTKISSTSEQLCSYDKLSQTVSQFLPCSSATYKAPENKL